MEMIFSGERADIENLLDQNGFGCTYGTPKKNIYRYSVGPDLWLQCRLGSCQTKISFPDLMPLISDKVFLLVMLLYPYLRFRSVDGVRALLRMAGFDITTEKHHCDHTEIDLSNGLVARWWHEEDGDISLSGDNSVINELNERLRKHREERGCLPLTF